MARDGHHVIDTHHHMGSLAAMGFTFGPEDLDSEEADRRELAARLETMDHTGVDQVVVIPGHLYLRPGGLADTRGINDGIAAYRDTAPDRFVAAVGIVEPLYGPAGLEELERIQRQLGLVGVSFHARFQGVATNSPLVVALVERMAELGLVPVVHAVGEVPDEALWRVQELAQAVPGVSMLVLDAFGSHEGAQQTFGVARACPLLVFDTSLAFDFHWMARFVAEFGADRLAFGTDVYSRPEPQSVNRTLDQVLDLSLSDGDLDLVRAGNCRRLLLGGEGSAG
jgi:uncharacterized protein